MSEAPDGDADGGGEFAGEVALVTGASAGIGAATARRFARDGAAVVLAARRAERLDELAAALRAEGTEALAVPTDVTDREAVEALVAAGTGERRNVPIADLPPAEFETVTRTNVDGAFHTAAAAVPALRETSGSLVFLGSYKGHHPSSSTPVYAASKWWLRGFAASLAARLGPDGVGVTVVNPSGVPTEFGRELRETTNADRLDPDATLSAADVADAVVYAAGQDAPATVTELDLYRRDILGRF